MIIVLLHLFLATLQQRETVYRTRTEISAPVEFFTSESLIVGARRNWARRQRLWTVDGHDSAETECRTDGATSGRVTTRPAGGGGGGDLVGRLWRDSNNAGERQADSRHHAGRSQVANVYTKVSGVGWTS